MYLIRLDDASMYWNKEKWHRMHDLLSSYGIKPIVAIIPENEDGSLLKYEADGDYCDTIHAWIDEGWTPALHGYNHVYCTINGGINPVNPKSEFAGLPREKQREKINKGYKLLLAMGIDTKVFVAPAHTFDKVTLEVLKEETKINIISDTIAFDTYFDDGFYFIPQQSGQVRSIPFPLVTFCYHPNTTTEEQFNRLEKFIIRHREEFIGMTDVRLQNRKCTVSERLLSKAYFLKRKLRVITHKSKG